MKKFLPFLLLLATCTGSETNIKVVDAESYRNRNLALAYIDSGFMAEASEKLAVLESLIPEEAMVYANQGVVALRQNELEKASTLLARAATLKPDSPEIALLQGQIAMLTGEFEKGKTIKRMYRNYYSRKDHNK